MTKFRVKLCTLLATVFVACVMCGVCMFTFADGASAAAVDENGWNTQVTRGDAKADVGHSVGDDGYSTFTDLQNGDKITFSEAVKIPFQDVFGSGKQLSNQIPFRLDIKGKGTGNIKWVVSAKKLATVDPSTGERTYSDTIVDMYWGTMEIGGASLVAAGGVNNGFNGKQVAAGQPVSFIFDKFSAIGGEICYPETNSGISKAFTMGGGEYQQCCLNDETDTLGVWYGPEEAYITIVAEGDGIESIAVNLSHGLTFSGIDDSWNWTGFEEGYAISLDGSSNIYRENLYNICVFKNVLTRFALASGTDRMPYVTIGGTRVDIDTDGFYSFTLPSSATSGQVSVSKGDFTVSYMHGETKLLDTVLKSGDKAYDKDIAIAGKRITGWYADAALTQAFDFNTALTADTTLYAKTVDVLVVNFKDGDEVLSFQNIDDGAKAVQPADPEKEGMTFIGWFTAPDGKTAFDFDKAITGTTDVYAVFGYNVTAKVLGFNGKNANTQTAVVPVMNGGKITEEMMPSFGQITGFPEYTNIELVWYTDATMAEKVNFGANGVTVEGPLTFIAAIKDKDIEIANEYVRPNADGWDRNRSGGKDADGNVLTANQTLAPNSKYGSAEAMKSVDGYSDINIDYVGYIANTRKFDVTKDIYLSYTLDSKNESANDKDGPKHEQKHFFVGMFNSLTGALINQGQMHETNFGSIAVFGHRVNTEVQANDTMGAGKINVLTGGSSEKNSFTYEEGKPVDLKITIGTDNTKIYQLKEGNWVEIATMDATQKMFPDGMYLVLETTRITWLSARASQVSTVTKGAVSNGTFTIDTAEAATGLLSGERVYFTATPAEGYQFSEEGVFADGAKVSVGYDETKKSYYFNMPFGASEVTVKFSVPVTFMADGKEVNEKLYVLAGEIIDEFDVDAAPEKTGHSFAGWFEDEALTKAFDFENTVVSQATTLYAKYDANQYTITFMDGENKYKTATAAYGDKFVAPEAPEKDGFTFVGWFTDKECTKEFDFNTAVSDTVTVYAKWEANQRGCGSVAAVSASAAAAVLLLTVAAVALAKKKKAR